MNTASIPRTIAYALGLRDPDADLEAALAKISDGLDLVTEAFQDYLDGVKAWRLELDNERAELRAMDEADPCDGYDIGEIRVDGLARPIGLESQP